MYDHNLILQVERVVSFIKIAPFNTSVLSNYRGVGQVTLSTARIGYEQMGAWMAVGK